MRTMGELKAQIDHIDQEAHDRYAIRRKLELQFEQLGVEHLLSSKVLTKLVWEIQNEQQIGSIDGSWYELTNDERLFINFGDGFGYNSINMGNMITLSYDLDDGELWISSSSTEKLIEFIKENNLTVDASRMISRKDSLLEQLDNVNKILNTFGVE